MATTTSSVLGTTSSLGIGSGLDLDSILSSLEEIQDQKITQIEDQIDTYEAKSTAYDTLSTALTTLSEATAKLSETALYDSKSVSTNTAFTAEADSDAATGSYSINVQQLATAESLVSEAQSSKSTTLSSSDSTLTITVGGVATEISLTADQTSLSGLMDAINNADAGVTASIMQTGDSSYQLVITSADTGAESTISISSTDDTLNSFIGYDSSSDSNGMTEAVAAQDAILTVNGVTVTRSSNTVTDVPSEGVTLTLTAVSTSTETLKIEDSTDDLTTAINDWVDAYNDLIDTFSDLTEYTDDDDDTNDGALKSDSVLRNVKNALKSLINSSQSGDYSVLSELGISFDTSTGKLSVDDDALAEALESNTSAVKDFFVGDGTSTGLATQMVSTIETYTDEDDGIIATAKEGVEEIIERLEEKKTSTQEHIDAYMDRLTTKFIALDTLISELDSTSSYLDQAFEEMKDDD